MSNIELANAGVAVSLANEKKPLLVNKLTFEVALYSGSSIQNLSKQNADFVKQTIYLAVKELDILTNADLNDLQYKYLVNLIFEEYKHFKLDEVIFVLKQGVMGIYGKIYGKITPATILQWFNEHEKQRDDYFETKLEEESARNKECRLTTSDLNRINNDLHKKFTKF